MSNMINVTFPQIENYAIEDKIGSGSFSIVYSAVDKTNNRRCAIKYYKMQEDKRVQYYCVAREIAILKLITHPNIIKLYDYSLKRRSMYLVTEYFQLGNLSKYASFHKHSMQEYNIRQIVLDISSALVYLHSMKIYHGDLKFENVIISSAQEPRVKLIDFGLSNIYIKDYTCTSQRGGSIFNMAPEVLLGFPFNQTSDIFSLGVMLYMLIYGYRPFKLYDKDMLISAYKKRKVIEYPEEKCVNVSPECMNLVKSLLSYDKQNRFSDVTLIHHPFLKGFVVKDKVNHWNKGREMIQKAFENANVKKDYENAYLNCIESIYHLKIHYAVSNENDRLIQKTIMDKIREYKECLTRLEQMLNINSASEDKQEKLKLLCRSSTALSPLIDLGFLGEMYYKEKNREQALHYLNIAVENIVKEMQKEPDGERKSLICRKLSYWIDIIAHLKQGGPVPK